MGGPWSRMLASQFRGPSPLENGVARQHNRLWEDVLFAQIEGVCRLGGAYLLEGFLVCSNRVRTAWRTLGTGTSGGNDHTDWEGPWRIGRNCHTPVPHLEGHKEAGVASWQDKFAAWEGDGATAISYDGARVT